MQTKLINAEVELGHRPRIWRIQSIYGAVPVRCTFVMGFRDTTDGACVGVFARMLAPTEEEGEQWGGRRAIGSPRKRRWSSSNTAGFNESVSGGTIKASRGGNVGAMNQMVMPKLVGEVSRTMMSTMDFLFFSFSRQCHSWSKVIIARSWMIQTELLVSEKWMNTFIWERLSLFLKGDPFSSLHLLLLFLLCCLLVRSIRVTPAQNFCRRSYWLCQQLFYAWWDSGHSIVKCITLAGKKFFQFKLPLKVL